MKKHSILIIVLLAILLCAMTGCGTLIPPRLMQYSFAESESQTASIIFDYKMKENYVRLVDSDGVELPTPGLGTRWEPLLFPAGEKLILRVQVNKVNMGTFLGSLSYVVYPIFVMTEIHEEFVNFYCPPLEAGKEYRLTFVTGFATFGRKLVLTDTQTGRVVCEQLF